MINLTNMAKMASRDIVHNVLIEEVSMSTG